MLEILDYKVSGLDDVYLTSGLPRSNTIKYPEGHIESQRRIITLGAAPQSSGHDCCLKGITVSAVVRASQAWWLHFGRYHFADIVSSQSKMHSLMIFDIDKVCNEYVDERVIEILKGKVKQYKENRTLSNFYEMIYNTPIGLELTAHIVTNYLQLKTMYFQRQYHMLYEWKLFCRFINALPQMDKIIDRFEQNFKE